MPQRPFRHPPSAEMAVTGRFNRRKADFGSCSDLPLVNPTMSRRRFSKSAKLVA